MPKPFCLLPYMFVSVAALAGPSPASVSAPDSPRFPQSQLFVAPSGEPFEADLHAPYPVENWFKGADTDKDGRLGEGEFLADAERYFHTLDKDNSGELEVREIDAYEREVLTPLNKRPVIGSALKPSRNAPPPRRAQGAGEYGLTYVPHPIKAADRNMDARVTLQEYRLLLVRRFAEIARNSGHLTLENLPRTIAQNRMAEELERQAKAQKADQKKGR